ncbi:MAG: response regulator [Lentisphaerales bacterium]|nr:response regulator [Lentisphaerales bacterium]
MRILIIEDDSTTQELLKTILEPCSDLTIVDNTMDAVEAFAEALLSFFYYKVVLIDIGLPDIDGVKALKLLRSFEKVKSINDSNKAKIVLMTATADEEKVKEALKTGCNGFLIKPINKENLNKKLQPFGVKIYY